MSYIYWIIIVGIVLFIIIFILRFYIINLETKRSEEIIKIFTKACAEKNIEDFRIEGVKQETHDIYFENEKHIYYIKIIKNPSNQEICINNAIKWQMRKIADREENMHFVEGIEPLMRLDLTNKNKKEHKLFIIYPNTHALLKVINECEMVFVYPDTDVFGATVVTYKQLKENPDILEV